MNFLSYLNEKISNVPGLSSEFRGETLRITAINGGFPISVDAGNDEWTVYFGDSSYHEHLRDEEELKRCLNWAFSEKLRLRTFWRGDRVQKVKLEYFDRGQWWVVGTTGLFFFAFWRPTREHIEIGPQIDHSEII
jgi:hypothetical protein